MTATAAALMASDAPTAHRFRVAVFSYGLPCPGAKRGGIEQVAHDLANALVARGHEVTVFTFDPRPTDARYQVAPLPWRRFVTSWLGRRVTMGYLGNILALMPDYRDFDLVVSHGDSLLLPLRGKPVVRVMHGSALEEARSATSFGRALLQLGVYVQELLTACLQRGTVAVSENTRHFNPFIRRTIANGVDLSVFKPDPAVRLAHPSILFVGALTGRKRGAWLIDRFRETIQPVLPDAQLHMVTAPGATVPGVTYHTGVSSAALVRLYQQAWVYASPSTYEGFGLPYVEALACGTPVVATSNPGSREVLAQGAYGALPADDQFGTAVLRMLLEPAERQRMIAAGLARAAEYGIGARATQYERLFEELVGPIG